MRQWLADLSADEFEECVAQVIRLTWPELPDFEVVSRKRIAAHDGIALATISEYERGSGSMRVRVRPNSPSPKRFAVGSLRGAMFQFQMWISWV